MVLMAAPMETLWDHLNVALVFYKYLYGRQQYGQLLFERALCFEVNLKENADALPKLAILLHDLGKAYEPLQNSVAKKGRAAFHEYVSTVAASYILKLEGLSNDSDFLKNALLLSIIWHHTAMRGSELAGRKIKIENFLHTYALFKGIQSATFLELEAYDELKDILIHLAKAAGISSYLNLSHLPYRIDLEEVHEKADDLANKLASMRGPELYFFSLLLLHPLMVCDNYSANINRMGRITRFLIDLPSPKETKIIAGSLARLMGEREIV